MRENDRGPGFLFDRLCIEHLYFRACVYNVYVRMSFHISKSRVSGDKERIVHVSQFPGSVSARHALSVRVPGAETSSPVCIRETRAVYTSY